MVLWHSWAGADSDALGAILRDLNDRYPDLTVETLFVAYDELPDSYAQAVQAGGGPDLVFAPNWWLGGLVDAEVVTPLDDLLGATMADEYWPATVENMSRAGRWYGLPVNFELVSLYVNKELIDAEAYPQNTADMLTLAQSDPTSGAGVYANFYHIYWGIPAFGGTFMDSEGRVTLDTNTGTAEFLDWLFRLSRVQGTYVDLDYGMLIDRFKKGEFAFFVDGPWALAELSEALGENLAVIPLPAGPTAAAQPWLSADGLFLNPNADDLQKERALLVARHITGAESGRAWSDIARRLPANRHAAPSDDLLLQAFAAQAATAQSMPSLPEMDEVWGYSGDMLVKVLNEVMDPVAAVVEATALINDANGK